MNKPSVIKVIIFIIIISLAAGGVAFYIFQPQKTISPISSKPQENKTLVALDKQPSKTLKVYADDSGFSFKYPEDVTVTKQTSNDSATYASLEITSSKTNGSMSMKVLDTKVKSVDDWFSENKLSPSSAPRKEIRIGQISGKEINANNKIIAAGLDRNILFTIKVDSQNQKYWQSVYDAVLSSFNFVPQSSNVSETQSLDSSSDVTLEEETAE